MGPSTASGHGIHDRRAERQVLHALIARARQGTSGSVVVLGDAGVGKSALLDDMHATAAGCRVIRGSGIESEMEFPFAGLHQLCAPLLGMLDRLPAPQRDALGVAFGIASGSAPDQFLVGLAVLSLLSEASAREPLICLVDDFHWFDRASAQVLGFVARRLEAESVVLVFVKRDAGDAGELQGLSELTVGPLREADARALLAATMPARLDDAFRERIITESAGNPLALLELPRAWTSAALAGGFGLPHGATVADRIVESVRRRLSPLPDHTKQLLLVAAADPFGDPRLIRTALGGLGIEVEAADSASAAGLLEVGPSLRFRHPMVRSVVYGDASHHGRRLVHAALAEATDADRDPDLRAWHLAAATAGPDEGVALALVRSAGGARARGGVAAAAAFLKRAVALTPDPARRAERALDGAEANLQAGAFDEASMLIETAEAGDLDEFRRARLHLLRGRVAFAFSRGGDAPRLLMTAAKRLEPLAEDLARETYLTAWGAAVFAGDVSAMSEISRAIRGLPEQSGPPRPLDLLLNGFALITTDGRTAATPTLKHAARALVDAPMEDVLRWGWAATGASDAVWDDERSRAFRTRQVQYVRDAGALAELPLHLAALGLATVWVGDFAEAAALIAESESVATAIGSPIAPYTLLRLRAMQGMEDETSKLIATTIEEGAHGRQAMAVANAHWAGAVLYNALGRYEDAASAARQVTSNSFEPWFSMWALPELVEAASRTGDADLARHALERLVESTQPSGTDFGLGIEARARGLLSHGPAAEASYREAVERLGRTRLRPELGRAHLVYGEWLRREGRRLDAREQLRIAHDLFETIGMEAFAERARRELLATGEHVRKRRVDTRDQLTPQEEQIARLARDGSSNAEIGAQLFLSPRTVEWHLRKVFPKLGISSRRELRTALPRDSSALQTNGPRVQNQ